MIIKKLFRCLDQLRVNQNDPNRYEMVKYRNSKLTHLFQSYFEGRGKIKMVVCINPNMSEFDENVHVMQFAETARQVSRKLRSELSMKSHLKTYKKALFTLLVKISPLKVRQNTIYRSK